MDLNNLIALLPRILDRCSQEETQQIIGYLVYSWFKNQSLFEFAKVCDRPEDTIELIESKIFIDLEEYRLVVIGFEHLKKADARPSDVWTMDGEFGYLLRIPREEEESDFFKLISDFKSLPPVIEWAKGLGFGYVMFDRDARTVDDLPLYDWVNDEP